MAFSPDQARDSTGRWTPEGADAASDKAQASSERAMSAPGSKELHADAAHAHAVASIAHDELAGRKDLSAEERRAHAAAADEHERLAAAHGAEVKALMSVKATREQWANRPGRESLSRRLGKEAVQIKMRDGNKCVYCGKKEPSVPPARPVDKHQLDHLIPRVWGGEDRATNLVTACKACNSARHDTSVRGWASYAKTKYGLSFKPAKIYAQAEKPLPELAKKAS